MKITLDHIRIFNDYAGDEDHLARIGTSNEKAFFQHHEWGFIDQAYHDLELIKKKLVSEKYRLDSIEKIRSHMTKEAFNELTKNQQP